jgi:hypothetical protein
MARAAGYKWEFRARFRRDAFGWKSQPAILRVKQAVTEIKKVARKDPVLGAEGAVLFLERVSPALNHVDSSSGSIGTAVNNAIDQLVPIIARAAVAPKTRDVWLERLWEAHANEQIPYIESLDDHWGALCGSPEVASAWADRLMWVVKAMWGEDRAQRGHFHGTSACLSAFHAAGRHDELLELLEHDTVRFWPYQRWGVLALAALGRGDEAIVHAESLRDSWTHVSDLATICESILIDSGQIDEAYRSYGVEANSATTHLATFRALARKYPHLPPQDILNDMVASSRGQEGKWFAAAKDAGFLDVAIALAWASPCDPRTLTRAARDYAESNPEFAIGAGLAALHWIAEGHWYELSGLDVWGAYYPIMKAAEAVGRTAEVKESIRKIAASGGGSNFVAEVLGKHVNLP